jgi:putative ABC transport system permease protein
MSVSGSAVVSAPKAAAHAASVTGSLANYLVFGMRDVFAGRYFTDAEVEHNAPVVVLSHKLAAELAPTGDAAAMLGRDVRVRGRVFTTVGVMPPYTGETGYGIFIPIRGAAAALGLQRRLLPTIFVRASALELVEATKGHVIDWLATRFRYWDSGDTVTTQLARLEQTRTAMLMMKLVLGTFAAISLIVGGVGIMNVLLASVSERTREIGVRKAMGARKRDILLQFLAESVAMAGVGTGLGTIVGLSAALCVAWVVRWRVPGAELHSTVTPSTLGIAIVSAVAIGLAFGTFPALRASRLSPIDAIRHE